MRGSSKMNSFPTVRRRHLPQAVVLAATVTLAFVLHWLSATTGGLGPVERAVEYGPVTLERGADPYPRAAADVQGHVVTIERPARRVVSQTWSTDEFLYSIVPPEQVVGVSASAYERRISNVYDLAEKFQPAIAASTEVVLNQNPDLVFVSGRSAVDPNDLFQAAGVRAFRLHTSYTTLEEVADTILLIGFLTGQDAQARSVYDGFQETVRLAGSRKPPGVRPPRILGFAGTYSYGTGTLFNDIIKAVGGVNVAAQNGLTGYDAISTEQVLLWNPDWIVAGAGQGTTDAVLHRLLDDPAIGATRAAQTNRILVFEHHVFLSMSPFTGLILDALSKALYEPIAEE